MTLISSAAFFKFPPVTYRSSFNCSVNSVLLKAIRNQTGGNSRHLCYCLNCFAILKSSWNVPSTSLKSRFHLLAGVLKARQPAELLAGAVLWVQTEQFPSSHWWGHETSLWCARKELVFFIAACPQLCFGFVTTPALAALQCFGCCWMLLAQPQGFLLLTLLPWECSSRITDPNWPWGYSVSYNATLRNKNSGRGRTGLVHV